MAVKTWSEVNSDSCCCHCDRNLSCLDFRMKRMKNGGTIGWSVGRGDKQTEIDT